MLFCVLLVFICPFLSQFPLIIQCKPFHSAIVIKTQRKQVIWNTKPNCHWRFKKGFVGDWMIAYIRPEVFSAEHSSLYSYILLLPLTKHDSVFILSGSNRDMIEKTYAILCCHTKKLTINYQRVLFIFTILLLHSCETALKAKENIISGPNVHYWRIEGLGGYWYGLEIMPPS